MKRWNPIEMNGVFIKAAQEQGITKTEFLREFAKRMNDLEEQKKREDASLRGVKLSTSYTALVRYLKPGDKGPTKGVKRDFLYERIKEECGYDMFQDDST